MTRSDHEMLIRAMGSDGEPIRDLVEGWTFRVIEIANSAYRVEARSSEGILVVTRGIRPESVLQDALSAVRRRDSSQSLRGIVNKVRAVLFRILRL